MLLSFHPSILTWLSEDVWVGYCHSSSEVLPSVLSLKLPCYKLRLLGLKYNEKFKLTFRETLISRWMKQMDLRKRGKDIEISPETLFWLVRARWDAAERERSGYLKSPSHQSMLGHPIVWQRIIFIVKKAAALWVFQYSLQLSMKDNAVVTHYYFCFTLSLL